MKIGSMGAIYFEERPGTAAVLYTVPAKWRDGLWQGRKSVKINLKRPI